MYLLVLLIFDMSEFAHARAREFGLLEDCASSPSPDTFERLMSAVNPDQIERCLAESGKQFLYSLAEKLVELNVADAGGLLVVPDLHRCQLLERLYIDRTTLFSSDFNPQTISNLEIIMVSSSIER